MIKNEVTTETLIKSIVKGIEEKKGEEIVELDLTRLPNAICNHFIICNGNSTTQVEAIADSVLDEVRKQTAQKPWHVEGYQNKDWILLDFVDVVVHIFRPEVRDFYAIEDLWADAKRTTHNPAY